MAKTSTSRSLTKVSRKTTTAKPKPKRNRKNGRPFALDKVKRAEICAMLTAGLSLRKAAEFIQCDPRTIRREAQRNKDFRSQLIQARSGANVEPLVALRAAAQNDWRAAVSWMKCVNPEGHAKFDPNTITKREANRFVDHLIESIGEVVSDTKERQKLYDLLTPAMPTAMNKRWEAHARAAAMIQIAQDVAEKELERKRIESAESSERDRRRRKLREQLGDYLTEELYESLKKNEDLLDPREFFKRGWGDKNTNPKTDGSNLPMHLRFKPGMNGSTKYGPKLYHDDWKKYGWVPPDRSPDSAQPDESTSPGDDSAASPEVSPQ